MCACMYLCVVLLCVVLLYCLEAAFSNHQIVHELPPPTFTHPDFLKCLCSRHQTVLSFSAQGDQTWGISERYLVATAEDATV